MCYRLVDFSVEVSCTTILLVGIKGVVLRAAILEPLLVAYRIPKKGNLGSLVLSEVIVLSIMTL